MKVKLLNQIQKPVFAIGGDDLGKHYEIHIMDVTTDQFSNFELVEVAGDHVLFKKGNCSVRFEKEHDSNTNVTFYELGAADEWHSLYNIRVVDDVVFNTKDIQVGHDYKININGQTIVGCVDSVQYNAINVVFLDYRLHASTRAKNYVLKRLVMRFPTYDAETGKIKLIYTILSESDMHPSLKETTVFADDITIKEI